MAHLILTTLDLNTNSVLNTKIDPLASDPTGGDLYAGRVWYNTTTNLYKYYNGTSVVTMGGVSSVTVDNATIENTGTSADPNIRIKASGISNSHISGSANIALSKLAVDPLARANHTGTQLANTISDFDIQVRTSRLDQMAVPSSDLNVNTVKITNLGDPSNAQDAATKGYVDAVTNGLAPKDTVRVATTTNGTLATAFENGDTVDGVVLATGDRILLKNQTSGAENGIYVVAASGAPTRALDADSSADLLGASVFISEGTVNGNTLWVMTTDGPLTVGTTALVWSQFGGPGAITAGTGITVTGQQVSLSTPVSIANGGTNATSASAALANLGGTSKITATIGDGSATSYAVTHSLGTKNVIAQVYRNSGNYDVVTCDIEQTSTTVTTFKFASAPATNAYNVVIIG